MVNRHILHFLIGGFALFSVDRLVLDRLTGATVAGEDPRTEIVVAAPRVAAAYARFREQNGISPTDTDERMLVERMVEEDVLYSEALARRLHEGDRSVRYRLTEKMRFVVGHETELSDAELYRQALELDLGRDDAVLRRMLVHKLKLILKLAAAVEKPDDAELGLWVEGNRARYEQPARIDFTQVFFSRQSRGDGAEAAALELLASIANGTAEPASLETAGDRFPWGRRFSNDAARGVAQRFGPDFAEGVFELPVGEWVGPLASAYGFHLARVGERSEARMPSLDAVRTSATVAWMNEQREDAYRQSVEALRARYEVRVERPGGGEEGAS